MARQGPIARRGRHLAEKMSAASPGRRRSGRAPAEAAPLDIRLSASFRGQLSIGGLHAQRRPICAERGLGAMAWAYAKPC